MDSAPDAEEFTRLFDAGETIDPSMLNATYCPSDENDPVTATFSYPDSPAVQVVYNGTSCGFAGNGKVPAPRTICGNGLPSCFLNLSNGEK